MRRARLRRGASKGGKVVMTEKRETTGAAAKLVMTADRREVSADGEDVAMFAVAVHDAQGRVVPITDNEVTFRISGAGKLIGVGNGDPTDQESDKGTSRKAFSGLCMAVVQATKTAGEITVEATSPGLAPATVTIAAKATALRPQVAVWEREVPAGSGVTGLWRPMPPAGNDTSRLAQMMRGEAMVFTLRQDGSSLTGTVEGAGRELLRRQRCAGSDHGGQGRWRPCFVQGRKRHVFRNGEGRPDRAGASDGTAAVEISTEPKDGLAVGPPPDGTDPSRDPTFHVPRSIPMVLHRVQR